MRIGINLLFLSNNTNSGVGKHTEALLDGFRKINLLSDCYLFVRQCYYERAKTRYPEATIVLLPPNKLAQALINHKKHHSDFAERYYLNRFVLNSSVKKHHIDIMFYPFNDSTICFPKDIPHVFVIHDLYDLKYQKSCGRFQQVYSKRKHEYFLQHSNHVVTVSEYMKNEILSRIKSASASSIHVIPNAVGTAKKFTSFAPVDGPYILSVASQTYRENLLTLLRSYHLIQKKIPHQLLLIGKHQDMTPQIHEYIKTHDLNDRVLCLEGLPDEHRNSLYRNASLVVTPSLYESFGRVPIEAALLKVPVITSKSNALYEVTRGMLSYYTPPTDSQALAIKIIDVLRNPPCHEVQEQIASTFAQIYDESKIANCYATLLQGAH